MFGLNLWARPFLPPSAAQGALDPASSYLPNPLTSPALMVLASNASEGREGGQLSQAPLLSSSARPGEKEAASMLNPFAAAAGAFPFIRPGAPHIPGLHSPLWRPHLDPATLGLLSARGTGAFHPLNKDHHHHEAYPSAFLPAKRPRLSEERSLSPGDGHDSGVEGRGSSPYLSERRPSPAASRHGSQSEDGTSDHGDRYTPDSSVKDLSKWASPDGQGICCPICQALLQPGEVQSHLTKELTELNIMLKDQIQNDNSNIKKRDHFAIDVHGSRDIGSKSRYETFLRIKGNREARLAKVRGRRRRYNEMAQQLMHSSSSTSSNVLDSSTEQKENLEDEQIDIISCDESKESAVQSSKDAKKDSLTCSECLEPYTNCSPITSMQCWHVHCEKCWVKAMESSKQCPQCKSVTSPADLRRIFI